jgi:hypothetical protein
MLMATIIPSTNFESTLQDFRVSWKLLKANYRAFLSTELFAIGAAVVTVVSLFLIFWLFNPNYPLDFSENMIRSLNYRWLVITFGYIILTAFMHCQTGLAYDIMSSGEMYAEFKSTFKYFRQNRFKYVIISLLLGGMEVSFSFFPAYGRFENNHFFAIPPIEYIIGIGIGMAFLIIAIKYVWNSIFIQALASINAQQSLKKSLIESIQIFRANPRRILTTWALYFLIFVIPGVIIDILLNVIAYYFESFLWVGLIIMIAWNLCVLLVGLPMRALIVTGLYNNVPFKNISSKNVGRKLD